MTDDPKWTIENIQAAIERGEGHLIEILPDGTVRTREEPKAPSLPLTKGADLGDGY